MQDRPAVGAPRLALQPHLTDAPPDLVDVTMGLVAQRLESLAKFDDIAIAILPIVEGGEIVADGLEISQAILAYARALKELRSQPFRRPSYPIGRSRSGRRTGTALPTSITLAGIG